MCPFYILHLVFCILRFIPLEPIGPAFRGLGAARGRCAGMAMRQRGGWLGACWGILDDFGLQPVARQVKLMRLQILEDRYEKAATLICSQLPVGK
jgi:hypothetical protein